MNSSLGRETDTRFPEPRNNVSACSFLKISWGACHQTPLGRLRFKRLPAPRICHVRCFHEYVRYFTKLSIPGRWEHEGNVENKSRRRAFSIFLECSETSGVCWVCVAQTVLLIAQLSLCTVHFLYFLEYLF